MEIVTGETCREWRFLRGLRPGYEAWLSQSSQVSLFRNSEDVSGHLDYKKAEFFLLHLQFWSIPAKHLNCKWGDFF